jgi:hypothetical protein
MPNIVGSVGRVTSYNSTYKVGQAFRLPIKLSLANTSYITNTYDNVARLTGTYLDSSTNTVLDKERISLQHRQPANPLHADGLQLLHEQL